MKRGFCATAYRLWAAAFRFEIRAVDVLCSSLFYPIAGCRWPVYGMNCGIVDMFPSVFERRCCLKACWPADYFVATCAIYILPAPTLTGIYELGSWPFDW